MNEEEIKKEFETMVSNMYDTWTSIMFEAHRQVGPKEAEEFNSAIGKFIANVYPYNQV